MIKNVYDVFHLVYWDWRVAIDIFLGGLGVGAFLCAIALMFYKKSDELITVRIGAVIGPLAMAAGLSILLTEMGQPLRMYKTLTRFNVISPMSWGGIIQEGFIIFSAAFAVLLFTHKNKDFLKKMAVFTGFFALFAAFYHGFLLAFVTARPLWNAGAVSVASVLASVITGTATVMFLASFSKKGREEIRQMGDVLKGSLLIMLFIQVFTCFIWAVTLLMGKGDFVDAFYTLNENFGLLFWGGAVLVGLIFPFLILSVYSIGKRRDKMIPVPLVSSAIIIGGYIFRYVLIIAGQIS